MAEDDRIKEALRQDAENASTEELEAAAAIYDRAALVEKLHPRRFPGMSGKMAAILGYLLGEAWTDPALTDLCITSDGYLLGQEAGDVGMNAFLGAASDLAANLERLVELPEVGLTADETAAVWTLYRGVRRF